MWMAHSYIMAVAGGHVMPGVSKKDLVYCPLPLYHTAGGVLGCGQAIIYGCTVVLRRKFSASAFWKDCVRFNVTV